MFHTKKFNVMEVKFASLGKELSADKPKKSISIIKGKQVTVAEEENRHKLYTDHAGAIQKADGQRCKQQLW